jgi:hypothetical protein
LRYIVGEEFLGVAERTDEERVTERRGVERTGSTVRAGSGWGFGVTVGMVVSSDCEKAA